MPSTIVANTAETSSKPSKLLAKEADQDYIIPSSQVITAAEGTPHQPIIIPVVSNLNQSYVEYDPNGVIFPGPLQTNDNAPSNAHSTSEEKLQQCVDLVKNLTEMQRASDARINARISSLEKRAAHQSTQLEFILDTMKNCKNQVETSEAGPSFVFQPIDDSTKLRELDRNLEDATYKANLMRWLRINVSGDCADDRMISVLDLLMTRKCQTHCTWTGASRKGAKTPIMIHQHMLKVFEEIGNSEVEIVTKAKLAKFFMTRLKNAGKRLETTGLRRSSHHVIRKRKLARNTTDCQSDEQVVEDTNDQASAQPPDDNMNANEVQCSMENQHAVVSDNSNTDEVKSDDEAGPSAVPTFSQEDDMDSSISSTDPSYAVGNSSDEDAAEEGLSDANASEASD
nr:uncharacterized protein LOC109416728 [Aedes albopictus]